MQVKNKFTKYIKRIDIINLQLVILSALPVLFAAHYFHYSNMPIIALLSAIIFFSWKYIQDDYSSSENIFPPALFSFAISLAFTLGSKLHFVHYRAPMNQNYIEADWQMLPAVILLGISIFPLIMSIIKKTSKNGIIFKNSNPIFPNIFFIISWVIIFTAWLPYALTFYPGGIVGDGAHALEMAIKPGVSNAHWGVLFILLLKLFLFLGKCLKLSYNSSIFIYALCEAIFYSGICAAVASKIYTTKIHPAFPSISVAIYALSGFFALYGITLWKDTIFAGAIIMLSLFFWDICSKEELSIKDHAYFAILTAFICLWRNNGVYIIILCIIAFLFIKIASIKKLAPAGLCVVILFFIIQGPVYDTLNIKKDDIHESLSIPIQQLAATVNEDRELTEEQKNILFSIYKKEQWKQNYCPSLSDDMKKCVSNDTKFEFLKVWGQLLIPNLDIYTKAYLMQTAGFWQLNTFKGQYSDYWHGIEDIFNRGYKEKNLLFCFTGCCSVKQILLNNLQFIPSGNMVWLMLLSILLIICQKNYRNERLLILLPFLASWLTIMIATPIAYAYRYILMLPTAFPIILILPWMNKSETFQCNSKEKETSEENAKTKSYLMEIAFILIYSMILSMPETATLKRYNMILSMPETAILKRYNRGTFEIKLSGKYTNSELYIKNGLLSNENLFFMDGRKLPASGGSGK